MTRYYKTLCENLQQKLQILEGIIARSSDPDAMAIQNQEQNPSSPRPSPAPVPARPRKPPAKITPPTRRPPGRLPGKRPPSGPNERNIFEAMMAQATPPAGTSPTGPMGPPSPTQTPSMVPGQGPGTSPTSPPDIFPPPPSPANYPLRGDDPEFYKDYIEWLKQFNRLPANHPARQKYRPGSHPRPNFRPKQRQRQGPGGGTINP